MADYLSAVWRDTGRGNETCGGGQKSEEARAIERRLESLGELWVKCMGMGEAHGETNVVRVRKAYTTKAGAIPPLYTMQKDHKPKVEGEERPPSRPVCGAGMAATSRVGDQLCMFVERVVDNVEGLCESKSVGT